MHGAKGLSGKVVFIPTVSQEVLPSNRDLQATGKVIEKRRLLYVSLTRAKAACIVSHVAKFTQPQAFQVKGTSIARTARSQFLTEMGVPSTTQAGGLTPTEVVQILNDIKNL
jgi:superfamily I DNA/RNA helicase